jgi:hypothetical protein
MSPRESIAAALKAAATGNLAAARSLLPICDAWARLGDDHFAQLQLTRDELQAGIMQLQGKRCLETLRGCA